MNTPVHSTFPSFYKLIILFLILIGIAHPTKSQCILPEVDGEVNVCLNSIHTYAITNGPLPIPPVQYVWTITGGESPYPDFSTPAQDRKQIHWTYPGTWTLSVYLSTCGTSYTKTITVNVSSGSVPPAPGNITGSDNACLNQDKTYSVVQQPGVLYEWKVRQTVYPFSVDTSFPISVSGNQATITWNKTGKYNVFVHFSNGTCTSPQSSSFMVGVGPPPQPQVSYTTTVCTNTAKSYYVSNPFPGTTYTWSYTGDGTITSSGSTATVNYGPSLTNGTVKVIASNSCGSSSLSFNVTLLAPPPQLTISVPEYACASYPVTVSTNASSSVEWEVTPPYYTTSGNTIITFTNPGTYTVRARTNSGTCYSPYSEPKTITVNNQAGTPLIAGTTIFCQSTNKVLSIADPVPGTVYTWSAEPPISINGLNDPVVSNTITVTGSVAGQYPVTITASQPQGCETIPPPRPQISNIHVEAPLTASNVTEIIGSSAVCVGAYPYKINVIGSPSMNATMNVAWTRTGGGSLTTISNNAIEANWTTAGNYTLSASTSNACGPGSVRTLPITINSGTPPTAPPITGTTLVCLNNTEPYTCTETPGMTYQWSSTGQIVTSSAYTASIKWISPTGPQTPQSITVVGNNGTCDSKPTTLFTYVSHPAAQSLTFTALTSKTYGDTPFTVSATANSGLPITYSSSNEAVATVSGNTITIVGAGSTTITAFQSGDNCWLATSVARELVVNKATLTAKATNKAKAYGKARPALAITYTGFKNGENVAVVDSRPTATTTVVNCSNAGTYPITLSGGSDNNYTITLVNGTMTVTKAPLTVTATSHTKIYGAEIPAFTMSYSGFVCSDTDAAIDTPPSFSTLATACSDAGSYAITLSGGIDNNYTMSLINGVLTIDKAPLTATADNQSRAYGAPETPLTITYTGFACDNDPSMIDSPPQLSTPATQASDAGSYPITLAGGSDNNYTITLVDGTLTIGKADQTITFHTIPIRCSLGSVPLTATASSGLPVTYSSSNTAVVTISGSTANVLRSGSSNITASQNGNANYNAATPVVRVLTMTSGGTISAGGSTNICQTGSVRLTAGSGRSYSWNTGASTQAITAYDAMIHTVTYINSNNCTVSASINITRSGSNCIYPRIAFPDEAPATSSGHEETPEVSELTAYPNPANEVLTVIMPDEMKHEIPVLLYTIQGKKVIATSLKEGERKTTISMADLDNGFYILRVGTGHRASTTKVVVLHR